MKAIDGSVTDTSLKQRLVVGSLGLACLVSIIYIVVAYRLASDLAVSTESIYLNKQFEWAYNQATALQESSHSADAILAKLQTQQSFQVIAKQFAYLEITLADSSSRLKNAETYDILETIRTEGLPESARGNENNLFWQYRRTPDSTLSVLMVHPLSTSGDALAFIVKRLSITAFLTFWLTLWAALTMSAIITRRFQDNNDRLAYLAMHDELSGLKNRTYLTEVIDTKIQHGLAKQTSPNKPLGALLIIDLNKFKDVNDTFGHTMGDEVLKHISQRLAQVVSKEHILARFGGDEFIVWCESAQVADINNLVSAILSRCSEPLPLGDIQFEVGASIGVSMCPRDGTSLDALVKHADIAMYQAKKLRSGYEYYQQTLPGFTERQIVLRGQLNQAIDLDQFVLVYQPKVSLPDGRIVGVEALARWHHPADGLLGPVEFIDLVEQSGVIHSFSRFVIAEAIRQAKQWADSG